MKLLSTSWRSFAGEVQCLAVHWFKTKCSPKNLFNRFLEYSRKVFQPWHFVQIDDCSVKIRFWCGEKISPLFDMVAVWKGKAGAHAQWKIHDRATWAKPQTSECHRLCSQSLSGCLGKGKFKNQPNKKTMHAQKTIQWPAANPCQSRDVWVSLSLFLLDVVSAGVWEKQKNKQTKRKTKEVLNVR